MSDGKICPKCREQVDKKATKCPHCHSDIRGFFGKHPILALLLVVMFVPVFISVMSEEMDNGSQAPSVTPVVDTGSNAPAAIEANSTNIEVTNQIVKKVAGKHRFFFDIRNKGKEDFTGSVKIKLISMENRDIWDDTFDTSKAIAPGLGTIVYSELSTGPTSVHGSAGINRFTYEVIQSGRVVQTGAGRITDKYEDLSF
ncbi:MAG: hypothetical protein WCW25_03260 [Patescibacteria group bacterium]|jgi:hypothetical protein